MSDDLIKRSDAIKAVREYAEEYTFNSYHKGMLKAVSIIADLPSADRPQGEVDAIDRDALIDYCLKLIDVERKQGSDVMNYGQERVNQTEAIIDYIEHMPHVNADRPRGEWIKYAPEDIGCYNCECSLCQERFFIPLRKGEVPYSFCPNCGADMREREGE